MAETIALQASAAGKTSEVGADGLRLAVPTKTSVTFTATVEGFTTPPSSLKLREGDSNVTDLTPLADNPTTFTASHEVLRKGVYTAEAPQPAAGGAPITSAPVIVAIVDAIQANEDGDENQAVAEVDEGEFDGPFAVVTGIGVSLIVAIIVVLVIRAFGAVQLPELVTTISKDQLQSGSFGERIAAHLSIAALGVGAFIVVYGAWLGGLETRGRLKARVTQPAAASATRSATAATALGDSVAKVFEKLTRMRAVVALLACGTLLILASQLVAWRLGGNDSTDTSTSTTTLPAPAPPGEMPASTASVTPAPSAPTSSPVSVTVPSAP